MCVRTENYLLKCAYLLRLRKHVCSRVITFAKAEAKLVHLRTAAPVCVLFLFFLVVGACVSLACTTAVCACMYDCAFLVFSEKKFAMCSVVSLLPFETNARI